MRKKLIDYFQKLTPLNSEEIQVLTESMDLVQFPKGTHIVEEGGFLRNTYFVLEGMVKQYKLIDGSELSTRFFSEEQWIIAPYFSTQPVPADYYLKCMEDTTLVSGNEEKAAVLFQQFPHFERIARKIVEDAFATQQNLMNRYITSKPEQRYLDLLELQPDLLRRLPQYDIASYIGVKPESLSRIRKKLAKG